MANFVWFYGPTAVGKDTLIHKLAEDPTHPLISAIGLVPPFYIHRDAMRLRQEERIDLVSKIEATKELGKTILIKAQGYDIDRLMPLELKNRLPDGRHLVVHLDAQPDILQKRRHKRGSPKDPWDDTKMRIENIQFALRLEKAGMDFIWLDNGGNMPKITNHPYE